MRRLITIAAITAALTIPALPALAIEDISVGCVDEVTGEAGLATIDGCITPAEYDALFSVENLSAYEDLTAPGQSIAEVVGLVDDGVPASERTLGAGLSTPFTFAGDVAARTTIGGFLIL